MQDAGPRAQISTGSKTNTEQETKRVDDEEWESFKEGLNEWMRRSESRGRRGYLLPIPSARRGEAVTVRGAGGLNREEGNMCTPRRKWSRKGSQKNFIRLYSTSDYSSFQTFPGWTKMPLMLPVVAGIHTEP